MKAVVVLAFGDVDSARFEEVVDPRPGVGQILVDAKAVDVNFPDILYIEGRYQDRPELPFSPGLGATGRVAEVGAGVEAFSPGQRVLVLPRYGAYAEKVLVAANECFPLPADVPFDIGAALGLVYQTAFFALIDRGKLAAGDVVLVLGASGGVGMAAIQLARAMGARSVIAATRGSDGADFVRKVGADVVVDSSAENLRTRFRAAVLEQSSGHGADVVIDPVGGDVSAAALRVTAWCGRFVVVGFASGDIPKIGANYLLVKNIAATGLQWTDYRDRAPERAHRAQEEIFALWSTGKLRPEITERLPLAEYAAALRKIRGGQAKGKTILLTQHGAN
jgi:NADPH2:quinone reductase